MLLRDVAKIRADVGWEQVEDTLSIFGNEGVEKEEALDASGKALASSEAFGPAG